MGNSSRIRFPKRIVTIIIQIGYSLRYFIICIPILIPRLRCNNLLNIFSFDYTTRILFNFRKWILNVIKFDMIIATDVAIDIIVVAFEDLGDDGVGVVIVVVKGFVIDCVQRSILVVGVRRIVLEEVQAVVVCELGLIFRRHSSKAIVRLFLILSSFF